MKRKKVNQLKIPCDIKFNFVRLKEKEENELIKKIAGYLNRILDEKSRPRKNSSPFKNELLEDVLNI